MADQLQQEGLIGNNSTTETHSINGQDIDQTKKTSKMEILNKAENSVNTDTVVASKQNSGEPEYYPSKK